MMLGTISLLDHGMSTYMYVYTRSDSVIVDGSGTGVRYYFKYSMHYI